MGAKFAGERRAPAKNREFAWTGARVEKRWAFIGRREFAADNQMLDFSCQNS
jgi:hypothetical protein